MAAPDPIAAHAAGLATAPGNGAQGREQAVEDLVAAGDRGALEQVRSQLTQRINQRSDDYEATAALTLVNKALATVGRVDPYSWKHRRKP